MIHRFQKYFLALLFTATLVALCSETARAATDEAVEQHQQIVSPEGVSSTGCVFVYRPWQ